MLASIGAPVVPALLAALDDPDPEVAARAGNVLERMVPSLSEEVVRRHAPLREMAERLRREAWVRDLVCELRTWRGLTLPTDADRYPVSARARQMASRAVPALIRAMDDRATPVVVRSCFAILLGLTRDARAIPHLIEALLQSDQVVLAGG